MGNRTLVEGDWVTRKSYPNGSPCLPPNFYTGIILKSHIREEITSLNFYEVHFITIGYTLFCDASQLELYTPTENEWVLWLTYRLEQ